MYKLKLGVFGVILGVFGAVLSAHAGTEQKVNATQESAPTPRVPIGVVNMMKVMQQCTAFKKFSQERDKKIASLRGETEKAQQSLNDKGQEFSKRLSAAAGSDSGLEEKLRREFHDEEVRYSTLFRGKEEGIAKASQQAEHQIRKALHPVLSKLKKERGLAMVVDNDVVPLYDSNLDMTKVVLEELNKSLPEVKISFDAQNQKKVVG